MEVGRHQRTEKPKLARIPVNPRGLAGHLDLPSATKQLLQGNRGEGESYSPKWSSPHGASSSSNFDTADKQVSSMIAACDKFLRRWRNHWQNTQSSETHDLHLDGGAVGRDSRLKSREREQRRRWEQPSTRRTSYHQLHRSNSGRQYRGESISKSRHCLHFSPTLASNSCLQRNGFVQCMGVKRQQLKVQTEIKFNRKARVTMSWPR